MQLLSVLVGFSLALWLCTVGIVAYTIWRYVYNPWKVMRRDIEALRALTDETAATAQAANVGRKLEMFSDEELAKIEARQTARSRGRAG